MSDQSTKPSSALYSSEKENELTYLADFILERAETEFERAAAVDIGTVGVRHDVCENNCDAGHFLGEPLPCDDWERATNLGISWLKSHIVKLEAAPVLISSGEKSATKSKRVGD